MNILVLGYYNRQNLGDDLFKIVFGDILVDKSITFENPDDIQKIPRNTDLIIVGGGDLVNDYFMNKIRTLIQPLRIPVYAIGIGFPYPDLATPEYVEIFDVIITRTKYAYDKLKDKIPIFYEPDLVYMMPKIIEKRKNVVGVFFANSICHPQSNLVKKLAEIVIFIANISQGCGNKKYLVELYSMNTSGQSNEDDTFLNKQVEKICNLPNVVCKSFSGVPSFSRFSFTLCTRYHSHVLSHMYGVPFVSLYSTTKVKDFLIGENLLEWGEEMDVDIKLKPISINSKSVIEKIKRLINTKIKYSEKDTTSLKRGIQNLLYYKPRFGEKLYKSIDYKISKFNVKTAKSITFAISGKTEMDYTWGLNENMKNSNYNIEEGIRWILKNTKREFPHYHNNSSQENRKYNFLYFDGPLSKNIHRAGWAYVVDNLLTLHNPEGIIVDTYMDKTWGWEREFFENIGYLPIKKPWIGFIHHTFNDMHSKNNLCNIVKQKSFIDSLKYCKFIIVLSNYLKTELQKYLLDVDIKVLYHPTEFVDTTWKKCTGVVNIGAWYRDPYAIYALPCVKYPKKILKGYKMENYFPPCDFLKNLQQGLCIDYISCYGISRDGCCTANKFVVGLIDDIIQKMSKVEVLENLSNNEYDELLSTHLVFIKLVDASACNTIIECIVRNTPIIVNKIPAVVEYLGEDYPLYYSTLEEAAAIINNDALILQGHRYLKKKDKKFLSINYFLSLFAK